MVVNNRGLKLIKEFEGLRTKAYFCPAGKLTIGYGHTGPDVQMGDEINEREAEQLLQGDLLRFEHGVESLLDGIPASFNQFSAMVSLAYNIGLGNFSTSSVLRCHRQGKPGVAANAFLLWVKVKGKPSNGLIRRRNAERALYLSD